MLMIYNKREILFPFDGAIFKWRQIGDAAPHSLFSRRSLKRSRLREIQIAGILKEAQAGWLMSANRRNTLVAWGGAPVLTP